MNNVAKNLVILAVGIAAGIGGYFLQKRDTKALINKALDMYPEGGEAYVNSAVKSEEVLQQVQKAVVEELDKLSPEEKVSILNMLTSSEDYKEFLPQDIVPAPKEEEPALNPAEVVELIVGGLREGLRKRKENQERKNRLREHQKNKKSKHEVEGTNEQSNPQEENTSKEEEHKQDESN